MWSHYSNSHSGFCVGLNIEIISRLGLATLIGPVFYESGFPEFTFNDDEMEKIVRLLTTKSLEWRYEKEIRIINFGGARTNIKLPPEAFKEIIIGSKCTEESKKEIMAITKSKFPDARIFQASLHEEKFELVLEPLN